MLLWCEVLAKPCWINKWYDYPPEAGTECKTKSKIKALITRLMGYETSNFDLKKQNGLYLSLLRGLSTMKFKSRHGWDVLLFAQINNNCFLWKSLFYGSPSAWWKSLFYGSPCACNTFVLNSIMKICEIKVYVHCSLIKMMFETRDVPHSRHHQKMRFAEYAQSLRRVGVWTCKMNG